MPRASEKAVPEKLGRQTPTAAEVLPYTTTHGQEAIDLYNTTGRTAQQWQQLLLYDILAENEDGLWVHTKFGYSVPRRTQRYSGTANWVRWFVARKKFVSGIRAAPYSSSGRFCEVEQYGAYKLITIVDNGRFLLVPKGVKVPADVPGICLELHCENAGL